MRLLPAIKPRLVVTSTFIFFFVISGFILLWAASLEIPDLGVVEERRVAQSTKIYDRTGEILLYNFHDNAERTLVPIGHMSRHVRNATVAIEDAEFYQHHGVRPLAVVRAILTNLLHGDLFSGQGGSTITQQVIKNAILTKEKTLARKLKEWILALKLERQMGKEQILELYLNESPYGGTMYGVEEASFVFFGKHAADLTLTESAYIAALPQAPTYYSPYGNHHDALEARKNLVLEKMLEHGFIGEDEYAAARAENISFKPPRETAVEAPHFVFFIKEYLEGKYGTRIEDGGYKVITTLDAELQREAQEIVKAYALENEKNFNAENAAVVAIDPTTGDILAMVGSRDYFDANIDGNYNIAVANRQPGSSFKPFVYAEAFSKGYTPDTVLFDVRTQFSSTCAADNFTSEEDCYSPGNYDNLFRGPITLRSALAQSINVPAVKLLYLAGVRDSIRLAQSMGITTLSDPDRYGLTLVLGGGEVRLLDMTSAYGVFATGGLRTEPTGVLRIEDGDGNVVEAREPRQVRVLSEDVAMHISDVLSDDVARAPAYGRGSALAFAGREVAVKTGTTDDYRDAWIIGYSPSVVVGAWAGNNDNSPMEKRVAGFIIAPLWHAVMEKALARYESGPFPRTEQGEGAQKPILRGIWQGNDLGTIDARTGLPATDSTPGEFRRIKVKVGVHTILNTVDRKDPLGSSPLIPALDPQFRLWEPPVRAWALQNGYSDGFEVTIPYQ
ncbi:MAG TPA: PBP1A family penicillin-binding protein [Candidatus Paceibacterota bacterium]